MRTLFLWATAAFFFTLTSIAISGTDPHSIRNELASKNLLMGDPGSWKELRDFFGLPYLLVEPEKSADPNYRANISVTPLGKTSSLIDSRFLENGTEQYQEGRKQYLQSKAGTLLRFLQPRHERRDPATQVHAFGYEYEMNGESFHEETEYLFCDSGDIFVVKGMSSENQASIARMKTLLETFQCAKAP